MSLAKEQETGLMTPISSSSDGNTKKEEQTEKFIIRLNIRNIKKDLKPKKLIRPRWYNQMNVVHMALKQFPSGIATRSELLDAAVALDLKISKEKGLPRVFTGKVNY